MTDKSDQIVVNDIFGKRRDKKLNILFFLSASKTYSFALPLSLFFLASTFLVAMIIWSGISLTWLTKTKYKNAKLDTELRLLKSKLFEYQSRYEDVYGLQSTPSEESEDSGASLNVEQDPTMSNGITEVEEARTDIGTTDIGTTESIESQSAIEQTTTKNKIALNIKNVRLKKEDNDLLLTFDLKNTGEQLQRGAVKAFVRVKNTTNGQTTLISSTEIGRLSQGGIVQGQGVSYRFNRQVSKQIRFSVPQGSELVRLEVQAFSQDCMKNWVEMRCNRSDDLRKSSYIVNPTTVDLSGGNIALVRTLESRL